MKKITYIVIIVSCISFYGLAQEETAKKGAWEISPSVVYSYAPSISEGLFKTELHLTYWFNEKWGGGLSYTHKFIDAAGINDDIALIGSLNANRLLTFHLGLNYTIPKKNGEKEGMLGVYNEAEFNFRPRKGFAYGPVIGSVISKETELYAGIHISFEL